MSNACFDLKNLGNGNGEDQVKKFPQLTQLNGEQLDSFVGGSVHQQSAIVFFDESPDEADPL